MSVYRHREESINTHLAILLSRYGVGADAETIHQSGHQRPDVIFTLGGVRVVIEGKYADTPNAADVVYSDADHRLKSGVCHIAVAVVYPAPLRTTATADLDKCLSESRLRFLILSDNGPTEWAEAAPKDILAALRRVHETLIQDDIVSVSAQRLSERIEGIAALWLGQPAIGDRLSTALSIPAKRGEKPDETEARRVTAAKVSALVLANALIFQEQLATSGGDGRVDPLKKLEHKANPIDALQSHWHWIWTKINYRPIFELGETLLKELPVTQTSLSAVRHLIEEAKVICANQSALRHDLMGRIYHWLLHHAKYLGTYYTATSSATLLLKLTFGQTWEQDFGTPKKLADFAVADLACGTGTLLMATAQALTDEYIAARARSGRSLQPMDMRHLHQALMENVLHGYDVLASAVHLTASTLGMLAPEVTYRKMNLYIMPMGVEGRRVRLGSLDFISHRTVHTQLSLDHSELEVRRTGIAEDHYSRAEVPMLDLCVMNPPFVRSVNSNLLFGGLSDDDRAKLQTELKSRAKPLQASVTAGLGSVFIAVADRHLRKGGRMAFILPVALATGEAWGASRRLLADGYHLETVMVSHDADRPNFSENTDLSEIMFIARKLRQGETPGDTSFINLWYNPRTIYEAMDAAERLRLAQATALTRSEVSVVLADGRKLAEVVRLPPATGEAQWLGVQFAQTWTMRVAVELAGGRLAIPGKASSEVALCRLEQLGALGPDCKRIYEAFTVSETDWSPYPCFWNHDSKTVVCMAQAPNSHLIPWADSPRGPDYGERRVWPRSGTILLISRLRTSTHKIMAAGFDDPVLGNTWWAFKASLSKSQECALLLWLNSSAALVLLLSRRVTTQGVWMQVKQPQWAAMPVLDVRQLTEDQLTVLSAAYDRLGHEPLLALAQLDRDPTRAAIDDAISAALGLPDMKPLRQLLAREPGLTGNGLSHKPGQSSMDMDEVAPDPVQLRLF